MIVNNLPDIVYHGTVSIHVESLKQGIEISKGNPVADFGQGFYTTSNFEEAVRISADRTEFYNRHQTLETIAYPVIATFVVNKELLEMYNGLTFDSPNRDWKKFILNNRSSLDFSQYLGYNKNVGQYHFVYGAVADSKINRLITNVNRGKMSRKDFLNCIKPLHKGEYDQLSFHSQEALNALQMIDCAIYEGVILYDEQN